MKIKKLTLGIVAHADAGKTTLSEAMLFNAKVIRKLGKVDDKNTALDTDAVEKRRGITIYSREARLERNGVLLQFIDTPGHVDFGAEMERVLPVLDAAVLVISGISGVENHTRTLWKLLRYYNIPAFIFVNKMDIARESRETLFEKLKGELSENLIDFSQEKTQIEEELAFCDDELFSLYTEKNQMPEGGVRKAFSKREFFPVLYGSALKDQGVDELMELVTDLATAKETTEEFGAYCYKVTRSGNTRLVHLKMTGGKLSVRENIGDDKVTRIRFLNGDKQESVTQIEAGDVAAVEGLDHVNAGDALGACDFARQPVLEPVISYRVVPPSDVSPQMLYDDMKVFGEEDPSLSVSWQEETKEVHIKMMGQVQQEVVVEAVKDRFGYVVTFDAGRIMYKETITEAAEGIGHFEPLRHYAEVRLLLEPGEPGSGIEVGSECPTDILDKNYQQQILSTLNGYRHKGVLTGNPLTDVKITLVGGQASNKHTMGGDFRKATIRAVRQGLMKASSELLEPWYKVTLRIKNDAVGRAMNDLMQMGGTTETPQAIGETTELVGEVPVSSFIEYSKRLSEYTSGTQDIGISNAGYRPCHNADEIIAESFYDPEMDSRNLPSSVFCFHGVGTNTPWYLVDSMARSEPVLKGDKRVDWDRMAQVIHEVAESVEEEYEQHEESLAGGGAMESHGAKKSSYQGYSGMSPELEEIFIREFGEIKRPMFNDGTGERDYDRDENIRSAKEDYINAHPGLAEKRRNENKKRRFMIVDGYNVIHASHELSQLFHENMDSARTKLVDEVENYQGFDGAETIVVFDAYNRKGNAGRESKSGKVTVVYTKQDQTADAYIEKFTHDHRDRDSVRVVTSDNAEQTIAIGNGAIRVTAKEFLQELRNAHL
ncbi:MAG: TetM/TetW/TetO/TetS family tetracycline resistance ribosomal protection protein [Lachnospiraceae bacterium]|nr:TetM/TetW/TetO/TetS family tetracycline resistance ribosomal protection protein [Lachnospiraceae bacterium]